MFLHSLVAELIHFRYEAVQKVTVVGYDNQCAIEIHQGLTNSVIQNLHRVILSEAKNLKSISRCIQILHYVQDDTQRRMTKPF